MSIFFLPCSSTLPPSTSQLVRNVVSVDYHLSKYQESVDDLQKEITHLKSKLASHGPINGAFDKVEAARLKALISDVYGCHGNVRKELAEAECSVELLNAKRKRREILYRRCEAFNISQERRDNVRTYVYYICVYTYFLVLCTYIRIMFNSLATNYIHMYIYTYIIV